jgi:shikimate kinase
MVPELRPTIALVGPMGSGKTTVARLVAGRLGRPLADLDAMLVAEAGCSVGEFFVRLGEPEFRRAERRLLARALDEGAGVVACGGGTVLDAVNRAALKARCRTVWLEVEAEEALRRLGAERE